MSRWRFVLNVCRFVVFLGLISGLMYMRVDHIYRSAVALVGLLILEFFQRKVAPPKRLQPFLKPLYNDKTMAILGIFIAVHVSLVNVPFTTIDLFHKEWTNADIISHFLGGLTVWVIVAEVLNEISKTCGFSERQIIFYSFVIMLVLGVGWEITERLSESKISYIRESLGNKARDLLMDTLGALLGVYMVKAGEFPFKLSR
ncbi:hypothetical protein [Thermococcus pacificus]|uniref:Uncharacterized protein n=1 Tax=Thermococcus pacificus TaxID=71998 RepID=A0A218P7B4_9EURY|nr:hypothetical protein [Thermococcus pacificus]ASJ06672.1 hypothetical protein A3L08_04710 [Thermococcus pacificus]